MKTSGMDSMKQLVRSEIARAYIEEAIEAHKVGAYRASIIATWIAVVVDITEKLRELELTGDRNAAKHVATFERAHHSADYLKAGEFERSILKVAKDEFELIGNQEFTDLTRLQMDRHRCAHPSITADGVYEPSAELAEYHIDTAVMSLLRHQPVQGKAALDRLCKEVDSPYFPDTEEEALAHFRSGPLSRPKTSLVRNFTIVLLKSLLREKAELSAWGRYSAALQAVQRLYSDIVETVMSDRLSALVRETADTQLPPVVWFIQRFPSAWSILSEDMRIRIQNYVGQMPNEQLECCIENALLSSHLRVEAEERLSITSFKWLQPVAAASHYSNPSLLNRALKLWRDSGSFDTANTRGRLVMEFAPVMGSKEVAEVMAIVQANNHVYHARDTRAVLRSVRDSSSVTAEEFDNLFQANRLDNEHFSILPPEQ